MQKEKANGNSVGIIVRDYAKIAGLGEQSELVTLTHELAQRIRKEATQRNGMTGTHILSRPKDNPNFHKVWSYDEGEVKIYTEDAKGWIQTVPTYKFTSITKKVLEEAGIEYKETEISKNQEVVWVKISELFKLKPEEEISNLKR